MNDDFVRTKVGVDLDAVPLDVLHRYVRNGHTFAVSNGDQLAMLRADAVNNDFVPIPRSTS